MRSEHLLWVLGGLFEFYLFIFREGKGGRKKEKRPCVVASCTPPTGDPTLNQACALIGHGTGDPLVLRLHSVP